MLRRALLTGAAVLALGGCGGSDDAGPPGSAASTGMATATPLPEEPVLAVWNRGTGSKLFWADPLTLEPVEGRSATVPVFYSAAVQDPTGDLLAVGGSEQSVIELVDLKRMRALGSIELGLGEFVERLHWVRRDLLLVSIAGRSPQVAAVDPSTGEILATESLGGTLLESRAARETLVFLLAPAEGIGSARVARFDGSTLGVVELGEIQAGYAFDEETSGDSGTRSSIPALAVDPGGTRAVVVPAGNRVAEIDLTRLEAAYHDLAEPISLLGQLRNWLEPAADAKLIEGPSRTAVWLPNGLIAVSGIDYAIAGDQIDAELAGLSLIDPTDWSVSRVSDVPGAVTYRGGALLGSAWEEGADRQLLEVFGPDGALRFTLDREGSDLSQVSGGHLYATSYDGTQFEIIDLASGRTVAKPQPTRETSLVYLDER